MNSTRGETLRHTALWRPSQGRMPGSLDAMSPERERISDATVMRRFSRHIRSAKAAAM
jgi:hypothetical protein